MDKKFWYWTPRVLGILFITFVLLSVFKILFGDFTPLKFLMKLLPAFILSIALFVAWRNEYVGGIIFIFLGIDYIMMVKGEKNMMESAIIVGPSLLIGILFLMSKFLRDYDEEDYDDEEIDYEEEFYNED